MALIELQSVLRAGRVLGNPETELISWAELMRDKPLILFVLRLPLFFFCHFPPKKRMSSPKTT
jgi:hypothetical protein